MRDRGLERAIKKAEGIIALARLINCTKQNVSQWKRVPAERVLQVSRVTKLPPHVLRPDLYPKPRRG